MMLLALLVLESDLLCFKLIELQRSLVLLNYTREVFHQFYLLRSFLTMSELLDLIDSLVVRLCPVFADILPVFGPLFCSLALGFD